MFDEIKRLQSEVGRLSAENVSLQHRSEALWDELKRALCKHQAPAVSLSTNSHKEVLSFQLIMADFIVRYLENAPAYVTLEEQILALDIAQLMLRSPRLMSRMSVSAFGADYEAQQSK